MKKMKMKTNIRGFFQPTKMTVITLLLQTSFFLFSFMPKVSEKSGGAVRKELTFVSFFQRVTINGDFSVVLTNDPAGTVMVEGDENDVGNIRVKTRNNDLVINMNKKKKSGQLTVYLSAATLKNMHVNGDGQISSTGTIRTDDLHIWLDGNVDVKINVVGHVSVDAFDNYDLLWKPASIKNS